MVLIVSPSPFQEALQFILPPAVCMPKFLIILDIACVRAKSLQLCLTLGDSVDCSPPGSSVHGILQARTLEWVAISFSFVLAGRFSTTELLTFMGSLLNLKYTPF